MFIPVLRPRSPDIHPPQLQRQAARAPRAPTQRAPGTTPAHWQTTPGHHSSRPPKKKVGRNHDQNLMNIQWTEFSYNS